MPLETTSLSEISMSILDPFSDEFLFKVAEVNEKLATIEENTFNSSKVRKKRAITPKFYLDKPLIKRLEKLKKTTEDTDVLNIIDALLTKTRQENSSINYLGLSRDDFSKISYMDTARVDRFKDETFTKVYLKSGATIKVHRRVRRFNYSTRDYSEIETYESLKITSSRVGTPIVCEKSEDGYYVLPPEARVNFYSRTLIGVLQSTILQDGRNVLHFENRIYNALSTTFEVDLVPVTQSMLWNPDRRYHSSVGKVVRKIFGNQFNDNAICKFAEQYFQLIVVNDNNYDLIFAEGTDIRKYYHQDSYLPANSSQLWNSCMRYQQCRNYFRMYEENPNCKLAVLLYKPKGGTQALVSARALIWSNQQGNFVDRIYFYNTKSEAIMKNQLLSMGYKSMREGRVGYYNNVPVEINAPIMDTLIEENAEFPYVDSLRYYDPARKVLTADTPPSNVYAYFSQTGGGFDSRGIDRAPVENESECGACGRHLHEDDMYYIERGRAEGEYHCENCAVWIDGRDIYVDERDAVRDLYDEYIYVDDAVSLCNGLFMHQDCADLAEYENNYGYFSTDDNRFAYSEIDGKYYHPSDPFLLSLTIETEQIETQIETQIEQINETNHETNQPTNTPTYGESISCATSNTTSITINTNGSVNLLDIL